jgi:YegS/Rv2252/BmrU family lipid kinase
MRAAAIFGLGCSPRNLKLFQIDQSIEWQIGIPASDQADVILIFGGDGTIHRHLSQLAKLALPVLVVPAGSGNDFARALGLRRVRDSIRAWRRFCSGQGNARSVDLGVITPKDADRASAPHAYYFGSVACLGLDAEVSRRSNSLPRWLRGHGGYALSLARTIFRFAPLPMRISTHADGNTWASRSDQLTILAAFANTSTYGGGMKIAPHARIDDGQLDVCVIGGIHPFKRFCMSPTVYFGRHLNIAGVDYFQAQRVHVETETPLDVYADGDFVCRTPIEISLQPRALNVLTP